MTSTSTSAATAPTDATRTAADGRTAATAVLLTNVTRVFHATPAVVRVDLRVERGETILLRGSNGAGKSTLLRIIATLLSPTYGGGEVLGFDLARDREEIRARTELLGHRTRLYEDLTATENLRFACRLFGANPTGDPGRAAAGRPDGRRRRPGSNLLPGHAPARRRRPGDPARARAAPAGRALRGPGHRGPRGGRRPGCGTPAPAAEPWSWRPTNPAGAALADRTLFMQDGRLLPERPSKDDVGPRRGGHRREGPPHRGPRPLRRWARSSRSQRRS